MPKTRSSTKQISAVPPKTFTPVPKKRTTKFNGLTAYEFLLCEAPNWSQKAVALGYDFRDGTKLKMYVSQQSWYKEEMNPERTAKTVYTKREVFKDLTFEQYCDHAGKYSLVELAEKLGFKRAQCNALHYFIQSKGWHKFIKPTLKNKSKKTASVSSDEDYENEIYHECQVLPDDLPVDFPMRPVESWGISLDQEVAETQETEVASSDEAAQETEESSSDEAAQQTDEAAQVAVDDFFLS